MPSCSPKDLADQALLPQRLHVLEGVALEKVAPSQVVQQGLQAVAERLPVPLPDGPASGCEIGVRVTAVHLVQRFDSLSVGMLLEKTKTATVELFHFIHF